MSLKAKIEAVIYASEEPVTLVQLTGLLGHEAQAEMDMLQPAQQYLALNAPNEADRSLDPLESAPQPTDAPSDREPEPTEESPIPEHPKDQTEPASSTVKPASDQKDEKTRERNLRAFFRSIVDELIADYATSARGLEIREVAGGYRLSTKPEYHDAVRGFVKSLKPPLKLSLQALETLAVVAYKQPVTGPEISEIRGVDSGGVLGSLMARKLITTAGRKHVIGRPILYKTTKDFLLRFGLKDVSELPSIEEFEKMAGELADIEPMQEEIPMSRITSTPPDSLPDSGEQEKGTVEPQSDGTSIPLAGTDESSAGVPDANAADQVMTDGRISGLPPNYAREMGEEAPFDSPAMDAELQSEEAAEESASR